MQRTIILALVLVTALAGLLPLAVQAKASPLGSVRAIRHGLSVQPPHHKAAHAKVKQKLYSAYHLATKHSQLASLSFKDGSTLHINQNTDLTLRSAHATDVKSGEVDVIDNGGHHQILTAVATASAIGTEYDVKVTVAKGGKVTVIVTVVSGTVMVTTKKGSQQVMAGEQITVSPSGRISQPAHVNTAAVIAWTAPLPAPASSNPTPTSTSTAAPTATATPTPTQAGSITATPLSSFLAPRNPINYLNCNDPTVAEFTVTATGLIPSTTYNLALTGSAGGVTLDTPIGSMASDQNGSVAGAVFTLPQVPAHTSWTLVASPVGGGYAPTTPLETDVQFCAFPSPENADGTITEQWAGEGFKPGATVMAIEGGAASGSDTVTAGPDGSFPPTTFTIHCDTSGPDQLTIKGAILDDPNYSFAYPPDQAVICS